MKKKKLHMIGNAHLDPVWLWNWQEGFQEAKATFRSALDRMKEDPEFVFTSSSACYYEWIEKNHPAMFKEIQARVKEGRWEIVGGWWIQPDCNIPSGEAFARQGLYGQRYFKEKFGKMAVTGYNVDSFGHNGNLPQILKKSGMDHYVFMRPMPLEKGLPGRIFWWGSLDGSKVMTYRIPYEYCTWGKDLETYTERLKCELEDGEDDLMMFYGVGNHGGGPTKENIKSIHALNDRDDMPTMKMGTTEAFFETVKKNGKEYSVHLGDLQHHASGCYSVVSKLKRENRQAENALVEAEGWSAISKVVESQPYPDTFDRGWKGVLFNQFHDILAGTSIASACRDASYLYGQAMAISQENLNYALQAISWDIQIEEDVTMKPIVVFNPHGWEAPMAVELEVRGLKNDQFLLTDAEGKKIPAQRIQSEATVNGQSRLLFTATLPSMGYEVFHLYMDRNEGEEVSTDMTAVAVTENTLENEKFSLTIDPATGYLSSLYDKTVDVEVLRRQGGRLTLIQDGYDTWAHNIFKFDKQLGDMEVVSMRILEEGPVRSTIRVKYRYHDSYAIQDFSLYKDLDGVMVKVQLDWREPSVQLKIKYPVNFNFRKPTYEIPFGYIEKSANGEEEPMQSWFDITGEYFKAPIMYGLSILNDGKYSANMDIDEMNLTVVRNAVYAHHDPKRLEEGEEYDFVDDGKQTFTYCLLPHRGSWKEANVTRRARELNVRPKTIIETFHQGHLPKKHSFVTLESTHVQISAIKESMDKDGIIVRAYETKKQSGEVLLKLPFMKREVKLSFSPCEIKTVKIPYAEEEAMTEVNLLEL